jgi:hypothetical protein
VFTARYGLYLCVLCGSQNKQRLFHCTTTDITIIIYRNSKKTVCLCRQVTALCRQVTALCRQVTALCRQCDSHVPLVQVLRHLLLYQLQVQTLLYLHDKSSWFHSFTATSTLTYIVVTAARRLLTHPVQLKHLPLVTNRIWLCEKPYLWQQLCRLGR